MEHPASLISKFSSPEKQFTMFMNDGESFVKVCPWAPSQPKMTTKITSNTRRPLFNLVDEPKTPPPLIKRTRTTN